MSKYEDKRGRTVEVLKYEDNIAVLNNGTRVAKERLNDPNFYRPLGSSNINENVFSNKSNSVVNESIQHNSQQAPVSRYERMLSDMNNGTKSTISIGDDNGSVNAREQTVVGQNGSPVTPFSTVKMNSVVESHDEHVRKLGGEPTPKNQPVVEPYVQQQPIRQEESHPSQQQLSPEDELLSKYANLNPPQTGDAKLEELAYGKQISNNNPQPQPQNQAIQPQNQPVQNPNTLVQPTAPVVNPVYQVFETAKRVHPISVNLKINEKIPDKGVMKMFEENFDESAIDYYTTEVYKKLMADPSIIEKQVKEAIKKYVNGRKTTTRKTTTKRTKKN